jgi:uncharacterized membrane protein
MRVATEAEQNSVTSAPPQGDGLSPVLARNIDALCRRRAREARAATWQDRLADGITRFAGSMTFVYLHLAGVGFWVVVNLGAVPGVRPWDESFVVLAMLASVEAIFLSTFVLITQNRMAADAEKRAELDLQISLLAEHEITKLASMVAAIAQASGVGVGNPREVEDIKRDVAPDAVLDRIEATER